MLARSFLFALISAAASGLRLNILHTNDMHSRFEEISRNGGSCHRKMPCFGGFARVKAAAQGIRDSTKNVIFLNAGDNFQGTPSYSFYKWKVVAEFIDLLGIDVMSLGNHEFDDDVPGLAPYLASIKTPNVACNLDLSLEPTLAPYIKPYYDLTVDGVNISVIGYLTPDTKYLARTGNVLLKDEVPSIRESAIKARASGAQIVIAVGHSGWDVDQKIARQVSEVDVVVGGHTNTFLYTGTPPDVEVPVAKYPHIVEQPSGKKVPVVQAFAFTKYLGNLSLEFDDNFKLISYEGNPILLDATQPKDAYVEGKVIAKRKEFDKKADVVIGSTRVDLQGSCRSSECNTGNFITDAFVDYAASRYLANVTGWTNAPVAILNSGSIRAGIDFHPPSGNITLGDVLTTFPFQNMVNLVAMDGALLKRVLEQSVYNYNPVLNPGNFLQVSGLHVKYDLSKEIGERVIDVKVRCGKCEVPTYSALELDQIYTVIAPSFIVEGGDNFTLLKEAKVVDTLEHTDSEILARYTTKMTPVHAEISGRLELNNIDAKGVGGGSILSPPIVFIFTSLYVQFLRT